MQAEGTAQEKEIMTYLADPLTAVKVSGLALQGAFVVCADAGGSRGSCPHPLCILVSVMSVVLAENGRGRRPPVMPSLPTALFPLAVHGDRARPELARAR